MRKEAEDGVQKSLNPFAESLVINVFYKKLKVGQSTGGGTLYESKPVETDKRVTLYPEYACEAFLAVGTNAQKLLFYILLHLVHNQDYLQLKESDVAPELGISRSSYYRALAELIEYNVIASRIQRKHTYWINPRMFFAGNRLSVYSDRVVKVNDPEIAGSGTGKPL